MFFTAASKVSNPKRGSRIEMQLVVIHYHLNRGGVTRVIESHLRGLALLDDDAQPDSVVILFGGRREGWNDTLAAELPFDLKLLSVPQLEYDAENSTSDAAGLVSAVRLALDSELINRSTSVVHVHNHSLGKNRHVPSLVGQLARDGWRLLLQPHDFAEELRPDNYRNLLSSTSTMKSLHSQLFPHARHIHYAVLNRRDAGVLENAGFDPVSLLPNPIGEPSRTVTREVGRAKIAAAGVPADRPYVLYPVRGIRRKNLGELLLWSAVFPSATFAVTLAPMNLLERGPYQQWADLASELDLNVLFDVGGADGVTLNENYAAADAVITTSIAEGFGLVFLEAAQSGLPLFGRDLPGITDDFRDSGMTFSGLRPEIWVPWETVDRKAVTRQRRELFERLCNDYGIDKKSSVDDTIDKSTHVDFGRLGREAQDACIRSVVNDEALRCSLVKKNVGMHEFAGWLESGNHSQNIADNVDVIREKYSLGAIGQRYHQICRLLLDSEPGEVDFDSKYGEQVLSQFVREDWLFPIRVEQ